MRATAIIAGLAPCGADAQDWADTKMGFALRGDEHGLTTALEVDQAASTTLRADHVADIFTSEPDRLALVGEYADWLVEYIRTAYAAGTVGARDDWLALARDWGFELADARNVTLWQGDRDDNVVAANARWLADHVTNSRLRTLPNEGHMSIVRHLPDILRDLLDRGRAASSGREANAPSATTARSRR
jgi:hypothetical protein